MTEVFGYLFIGFMIFIIGAVIGGGIGAVLHEGMHDEDER